ncbi:MAG: phage head closure protein [Deltaproteobacteria bacterium]|nr:phage head closure protein [Deltaproteobacteria bacterium]
MKCHIYDSLLLKEVESLYGAIQGNKDLDLIFSIKHARKVNKDNTVRFCGRIYQILPFNGISSFCGRGG